MPDLDAAMAGDAGEIAFRPDECRNVEALNVIPEGGGPDMWFNAVTAPLDLMATRIVGTWEPNCETPTIVVEMSEGSCAVGKDHKLVFSFDATAIHSDDIVLGMNTVFAEPSSNGISVRYHRPSDLEPTGEFGTCDGVIGAIDFVGEVDTTRGTQLQGRFELMLTPCDAETTAAPSVSGTFDVELRRGLSDVCPSM